MKFTLGGIELIRKLTTDDYAVCQELLSKKPAENLFIIGDIENFGFEQDFQKLWGEFNSSGQLMAILLKYRSNYICYSEEKFDSKGFASIINRDPDFHELSGLKSITDQILPYIERPVPKTRTLHYAKCEHLKLQKENTPSEQVQLATLDTIPEIAELHRKIEEFSPKNDMEESMAKGIETHSARTFYLRKNHKIVSCASTTAENSMSAMVVGVCTDPSHTKRGYASRCMMRLCEELLEEGKMLCLFYDNPKAGNIYKRLGFEDIGMWMMHTFEPAAQMTS